MQLETCVYNTYGKPCTAMQSIGPQTSSNNNIEIEKKKKKILCVIVSSLILCCCPSMLSMW